MCIWDGIRAEHRAKAEAALTVREALDVVASPGWRWPPGFFGTEAALHPTASQLTSFTGVAT
jgi:hypothetical protein